MRVLLIDKVNDISPIVTGAARSTGGSPLRGAVALIRLTLHLVHVLRINGDKYE